MTTITQRTFASGEVSPSLYARTDLVKYATGLRTCKNSIILRYGGASNRPGTLFVREVSDSSKAVRLIPFIYNADQTYVLEFGQEYMRVIKDGEYVFSSTKAITGITQADPAVVTSTAHGFSNGDEVVIDASVMGMYEVANRQFKVANVAANTFELQDMDGVNVDSTGYTAYSSGGNASLVYEIATSYTATEVGDINYVQSGDVVTLVHPSYPPAELTRSGDAAWTLTDISFAPTQAFPTGVSASAGGAGSKTFRYKVTAVSAEDGEESLPGLHGTAMTITAVTNADPAVVTSASHGLSNDDEIYIDSVAGMTELNGRIFVVDNVTTNTFELVGVDSTDYTAYSSAGTAKRIFAEITSAADPSTSAPHVISWTKAAGALEYNVYKDNNGVYGQIGIAQGTSFNDINITANTSYTPPSSRNPFIGTGNYPATVTYIQQRLGFANTDNDTEKIFLSRTANFKNFTTSNPLQDDDAITFKMAGRQVNQVKSMIDLGRLVVLTSGGEWSAAGDNAGIISPTNINTKQYSYNGSGDLQPIIIDGAALYQQARGSIIRDLGYDFQIDGYSGNDLTIFSSHFFDKYTLIDWAYQQIPHSILWVVRSDGSLLGMTYVRNQQVIAWHIHDTSNGTYENVAVVPEGNEDALYVVVRRTVNGVARRYIEKLASRQIIDVQDNIFMDSALTYDGRNTGATTMTLTGSGWTYTDTLTLTASASFFSASDVGNQIHLTGASGDIIRFTIDTYSSATVVTGRPHKTVAAELQATAVTTWSKAVDEVAGLWHLEGEDVAIFGDAFVVASPNNAAYDIVTVSNGKVTLDKPYAVLHIGLPYMSDVETLNIDTNNGETLSDKKINITKVNVFTEDTRGVWIGPQPPSDDTTDPLENLRELKIRNTEDYDSPPALRTDNLSVNINPEWNSNGRIFIRQVDPIPMTILSISPAGNIPFR